MGIKCLVCNHIITGINGLHLISKCENCGNSDLSKFIRVEDEDINYKQYLKDKEWLEEHLSDTVSN
ncbi:MAG: hypothetical protein ACTSRP_13050 [Candidatus Helarchaeota archaeon]